ncbi:DUF2778 domain-containing protein [Roseibium sp. HPY-6]|uniref:DUF2778 domain-containing protein n=1 Tax=Roseibium sp. HPY-6 TaxID=3229852 RepID=UPI00338DB6CC
MQLNRQANSLKKRARTFKDERAFAIVIAVLAIGLAAAATSVTLFGQNLVSAHLSAPLSDQQDIGLVHSVNEGLALPASRSDPHSTASTPTGLETDAISTSPASLPSRTASNAGDVFQQAARAHSHAQAKSVARIKLTAKLTHLNFARYIDAARKENAAAKLLAANPAGTHDASSPQSEETIEVAALGETMVPEADSVPETAVAASLPGAIALESVAEDFTPQDAVVAPVPGTKPAAPVRTASLTQDGNEAPVRTAQPVLAYATPGNPDEDKDGAFKGIGKLFSGLKGGLPGRGSGIAVYDISAATVHMPDGTKLEAHSGIGHRKDNPKYSHVRNLGPTPPNIYDLRMRERRFHGVEAIRMLPRDLAAMKGRDGMLAHSPLLRRTNGSHGCVAFKNYNKFLKAFKAGKVKKIIVVPSMDKLPKYMAALNRSTGT